MADHRNHRDDDDYYSQPGKLFRLMSPAQQQTLLANTARSIGAVPLEIQLRHIRNYLKDDRAYGEGVAEAPGIAVSEAGSGKSLLVTGAVVCGGMALDVLPLIGLEQTVIPQDHRDNRQTMAKSGPDGQSCLYDGVEHRTGLFISTKENR